MLTNCWGIGPLCRPHCLNKPATTNGTVTVNGKKIDIYVPQMSNGTNASINSGGWKTVNTVKGSDTAYDVLGMILEFEGNLGNSNPDAPTTTAESSRNEIQNKQIIRINGSDKGTLDVGTSNGLFTNGVGIFIDAAYGASKSYYDNTNTTNFKVAIQQNGGQQRAVIEVGNPKSALGTSGVKYLLPKGATGIGGLLVGDLENALEDMGYGKYTASGFFAETNIKATISPSHDTSPYTGYIGFDRNGNMTFTPIVYKDDKVQIVTYNNFDGFTWGDKVTYTFNNNSQGGAITIPSSQNKLINNAFSTAGVKISNK